ncbi:NAD(P)H-dependent oxidoreductase [Oceanicella sp. SM1341]|uniref:NAD(P)H-dependent oxidoreductase n=1 Tax=Oceanicella sp. SM1341 TaxID=1548889 RepID=UPI000E4918C5|nr:NAD(P)H-dependent oxidoreductase [Oceanicella sp. SM1341]
MKRALVLYAHPCEESFAASVHHTVVTRLRANDWAVDDCNLYEEGFSPVLSGPERRAYHDIGPNTLPVQDYVERIRRARALVMVFPVWNFGYPAILKGFFDRVFLPGVSFGMVDGKVQGMLHNIRRVAAVTTYGGTRTRATLAGDPPRRIVMRALRKTVHPGASFRYLALYDMNRATHVQREAHLTRVYREMDAF